MTTTTTSTAAADALVDPRHPFGAATDLTVGVTPAVDGLWLGLARRSFQVA